MQMTVTSCQDGSRQLKAYFTELKNKAKEVGLAINIDKIKILIQTRRDQVYNNIEIEEDTIEVVDNFTYLGVNLAKTCLLYTSRCV